MIQYFKKPRRETSVESPTDVFSKTREPKKSFRLDPFCTLLFGLMWVAIAVRLIMGAQPVAQVGDMVEFNTGHMSIMNANTAIPARLVNGPSGAPGRACTLDVDEMMQPGGVITVTAVRLDDVVMLWSGMATASGGANCGENSDLLVTSNDYSRLRMSQQFGGRQIPRR
jgi:hypothetical protein